MKAQKVWFNTRNIGDPLLGINGANFPGPVPLPGIPAALLGQFWIENDTHNTPRLCTFKTNIDTPIGAQFLDTSTFPSIPYNIFESSFTAIMNEDSEIIWKPQ